MEKLVFLFAIASLAVAQQYVKDPKEAAILSEKRYLSNNGQFGSAYTQEDGVQFTEESDQDGNRRGAYSYIDPNGQRRTITYTAGKNGFQASGDHIPVAPPAPAAPAPVAPQSAPSAQQWSAPAAPAQQEWSAPAASAPQQWSAPAALAPAPSRQYSVNPENDEGQYHAIYDDVSYWERQSKNRPAAPAPIQWSAPATAAPAPQWREPAPQQWSAPVAPAPSAQSWNAAAAPAQQQWSAPAPAPVQRWSQQAVAPAPVNSQPQSWEYNTIASTEAPHRFFPPGKLDLNRSPDGFSYSFSKS